MPQTNPLVFITDRSAAELDDKCGQAYWWNRKENGSGIVSIHESIALNVGREIHEDFAKLALMEDLSPEALQGTIDGWLSALTDDDKLDQTLMERTYRRAGWFAAWGLYIEPTIRAEYTNVSVESELVLDRRPLFVAVTPDRILRHRTSGYLVYRELKSTISASKKWLDSWLYAIQLHLGMKVVEEELGEAVKFSQIVGLMKGDFRGDHLSHPYVWGWYNESTGKWATSYDQARSAAWTSMPVWEYAGGVVEWVQRCGDEVARSQFPHSPPVFLNETMLSEWLNQRVYREQQIQTHLDGGAPYEQMFAFPKRLKSCRPPFGDACEYLAACWNSQVGSDPLASGEYIVRTPHHHIESIMESTE